MDSFNYYDQTETTALLAHDALALLELERSSNREHNVCNIGRKWHALCYQTANIRTAYNRHVVEVLHSQQSFKSSILGNKNCDISGTKLIIILRGCTPNYWKQNISLTVQQLQENWFGGWSLQWMLRGTENWVWTQAIRFKYSGFISMSV